MATTKKKSIFEDVLHLAGVEKLQPSVTNATPSTDFTSNQNFPPGYGGAINKCLSEDGFSPMVTTTSSTPENNGAYANMIDPGAQLHPHYLFGPFLYYCSEQYRAAALLNQTFLQYAAADSNAPAIAPRDSNMVAPPPLIDNRLFSGGAALRYSTPPLLPTSIFPSSAFVADKLRCCGGVVDVVDGKSILKSPVRVETTLATVGRDRRPSTKRHDLDLAQKINGFFKFSCHDAIGGKNAANVNFADAAVRKKPPPRFQCSECNRSYSTFSGLSKHKQFHCASQTKKQFGCKYCDKKYSSLGAMKMHIRTHTLPCKCEICGKAFSRPWLLQGHTRTHTGQKPFSCPNCGRAFADRSNLRAHLQTHSDVRKYRCKNCQKTFSRLSLLNKHETNGSCSVQQGRPKV